MTNPGGVKSKLHFNNNISLKTPDLKGLLTGGGTKTESFGTAGLKRAKTESRPKLTTDKAGHGVVTRTGNKGARQLERMSMGQPPRTGRRMAPSKIDARPIPKGDLLGQKTQATEETSSANHKLVGSLAEKPKPTREQQIRTLSNGGVKLQTDAAALRKTEGGQRRTIDDIMRDRDTTGDRIDLRLAGEKLLDETRPLLKTIQDELAAERQKDTPDPSVIRRLTDDIARLKQARREVLSGQIGVECPGFAEHFRDPLPSWSLLTLARLHGDGEESANPETITRQELTELDRLIGDYNDDPIAKRGLLQDIRTQAGVLSERMTFLKEVAGRQDPEIASVLKELGGLADAVALKMSLDKTADAFEKLLDRDPDFPIANALKVIVGVFPDTRAAGHSDEISRVKAAADDLETLADLVLAGQDLPQLQGHETKPPSGVPDKTFDTAYLKLKLKAGEERAVAHFANQLGKLRLQPPTEDEKRLAATPFETLSKREMVQFEQLARKHDLRSAEEAHALVGDFVRCGSARPDKEQIAACRKPIDDLTPQDRDRIEEYVLLGNAPDIETAHKQIRAFTEKTDALRDDAKVAVSLRHQMNTLDRNLGDILNVRRSLLSPTTWLDKPGKVFTSAPYSVVKDEVLLKALQRYGNKATTKDVVVLYAHIANFQRNTLKKEQELFGLHPGMKAWTRPSIASARSSISASPTRLWRRSAFRFRRSGRVRATSPRF